MTSRAPSDLERKLLTRLLSEPFKGRDEVLAQLAQATVEAIDENGTLRIAPTPGAKPATVVARVPVEAEAIDVDGIKIHVLLHVVDGRASMLEVFREDGKSVRGKIDPSNLDLLINSA